MKKLLLIPTTIITLIILHPTTSNSFSTGSPGAKTGSPLDAGESCTSCHFSPTTNSGQGNINITTDIPASGYIIGNNYTITLTGEKIGCSTFGFELTAENGNLKSGDFLITDNTTKIVNFNAVTHKSSGINGNTIKSWNMGWSPTASSTGSTVFYAALMFANGNGNNDNEDSVFTTSLTVSENIVNTIQEYTSNKELIEITDLFGKKSKQKNQPLLYIYDDGTVEKRIVIE